MSKILVTGGCGFIGSILVAKLQAIGCEVDVLDSLIYGELNYIEKPEYYHLNIDIRDKDALVTAFKGYDSVIHLAAYGSVVNSVENPVENFEVNAQGTFNVLNAAKISNIERRQAPCNIKTSWQCGPNRRTDDTQSNRGSNRRFEETLAGWLLRFLMFFAIV